MSTTPKLDLKIEPLASHHDRAHFSCGWRLHRYFRMQAGQDVRRKANAVFVLISEGQPNQVLGYYTLCATASPMVMWRWPRATYTVIPLVSATLIGRLAVAAVHQGMGLGALLLADAAQRAYAAASSIGSSMLIVDAIDERAAGFYEANGFVRLPDSLRLILPITAIGKLVMS